MKNFVAKFRKQMQVILTLLAIFIGIGYYYAVYIPQREQINAQAKFRTLQSIDDNIHKKLADTRLILNSVNNYIKDKDVLRDVINCDCIKPDLSDNHSDSIKRKLFRILNAYYFNVIKNTPNDSLKNIKLQGDKVEPHLVNETILIDAPLVNDSLSFMSTVGYKFNDFIAPLLRKETFDHYVVFHKGSVIYEDFSTGLSYESLDTLLNSRNKIFSSTVRVVNIGNVDYRMFLLPVGFEESHELIIGGLIPFDKWDKERKSLPNILLISLLFILVALILLIPFAKLALMHNTERINFKDIFSSYISLLLLATFCTFMVCFWLFDEIYFGDKTRDSLKTLSGKILDSFSAELNSAKEKLDAVSADSIILSSKNDVLLNKKKTDPTIFKSNSSAALLKWDAIKNTGFTFFTHLFWCDSNGKEYFHLKKDKAQLILMGNSSDRPYFKAIRDNKFNFKNSCYVEQVISSTDNKFKTVIAKKDPATGGIIGISCLLKSVNDPVLPYGFGFTILDEKGGVLYHSISERNLNEKFIEECDYPNDLIAGLAAKDSICFNANYYGGKYLMRLQPVPMEGLNYFLVTFFDTDLETAVNTRTISFTFMAIFVFFLFLLIELGIILLIKYIKGNKKYPLHSFKKILVSWLFIQQYEIKTKHILLVAGMIPIAIVCILCFHNNLIVISLVLVLLAAITTAIIFTIKAVDTKNKDNYNLTKMTGLLLFKIAAMSILPVICFYVISFNFNLELLSRFQLTEFNHGVSETRSNQIPNNKDSTYFYTDSNYINAFDDKPGRDTAYNTMMSEGNIALFDNTLNYTTLGIKIKDFTGNQENVDRISFGKSPENRVIIKDKGKYTYYSSILSELITATDEDGLFLIISCIILILLFITSLLWISMSNIFGLSALNKLKKKIKYFDHTKVTTAADRMNRKFVLVKGFDDPIGFITDIPTWYFIDFSDIPDSSDGKAQSSLDINKILSGDKKNIAILNFHYNMKDQNANRCKLNTIEKLLRTDENGKVAINQLIVFSEVEPLDFLDNSYRNSQVSESIKNITEEDYYRWAMVLGAFSYFPSLAAMTDKEYADPAKLHDNFGINYYRYYRLWQLLSMEEKIILVDLAEDGFMNTKNSSTLELLVQKHIITIHRDRFVFVDHCFEKFVKEELTQSEVKMITQMIDDDTSWKDYKYPVLIVIAGIIWFIFYSNPSSFGYLLPTLTALATGVPTLLKAISTVLPSGKKTIS